VEAKSGEQAET
jgi:hypothetical protein